MKRILLYVTLSLTALATFGQSLLTDASLIKEKTSVGGTNVSVTSSDEVEGILNRLGAPRKIPGNINSAYAENGPIISPDGNRLYFSRSLHPENYGGESDEEDIWYSDWKESTNSWGEPQRMGFELNNEGPNFINSISIQQGAQQLILGNVYGHTKAHRMSSGLSYSKQTKKGWTFPKNFEIEGFYNYALNADFVVSQNGKYLITAIERDDTFGGRDLYVSQRISDGKWSVPVNIKDLNTAGEESAPFLLDGKYLFFATNGYEGFGRSDIFVSKRLDNSWENWSEPINLGEKINDETDNLYFFYSKIRNSAFITRGFHGANTDIYELDMDLSLITELFEDEEIRGCSARSMFRLLEGEVAQRIESKNCYDFNVEENKKLAAKEVKYLWYFGDYQTDYGMNVTHCYDEPGLYNVSLTAVESMTGKNHYEQQSETIKVLPDLYLTMDIPQEVSFGTQNIFWANMSYGSTDFSEITYSWNFGDGEYGCGMYVDHVYDLPGTYKVQTLVSLNIKGKSQQLMQEFEVIVN